jgi:rare lipoprotein A
VTVRVNDRGPFVRGRSLDVARGAARALGMISQGTASLEVARLN